MQCQILFFRKNKKNIMSLLSAEFVHSMVSVKIILLVILHQNMACGYSLELLWRQFEWVLTR